MKVYLAAALATHRRVELVAQTIRIAGATVVSTWHKSPPAVDPTDKAVRARILAANLAELRAADAVVALPDEGEPKATFGEIGYALALGKPVAWVQGPAGEGANVFDAHDGVTIVAGGDGFRARLVGWISGLGGEAGRGDAA